MQSDVCALPAVRVSISVSEELIEPFEAVRCLLLASKGSASNERKKERSILRCRVAYNRSTYRVTRPTRRKPTISLSRLNPNFLYRASAASLATDTVNEISSMLS